MATHSRILAWSIPRDRGEPGGLQSMGSQKVGHNWATFTNTLTLSARALSIQQKTVLQMVNLQPPLNKGQRNNIQQTMALSGCSQEVATCCSCLCRRPWQPQRRAPQVSLHERAQRSPELCLQMLTAPLPRLRLITEPSRAPAPGHSARRWTTPEAPSAPGLPAGRSEGPICIWLQLSLPTPAASWWYPSREDPSPANNPPAFLILLQHLLPREPN